MAFIPPLDVIVHPTALLFWVYSLFPPPITLLLLVDGSGCGREVVCALYPFVWSYVFDSSFRRSRHYLPLPPTLLPNFLLHFLSLSSRPSFPPSSPPLLPFSCPRCSTPLMVATTDSLRSHSPLPPLQLQTLPAAPLSQPNAPLAISTPPRSPCVPVRRSPRRFSKPFSS